MTMPEVTDFSKMVELDISDSLRTMRRKINDDFKCTTDNVQKLGEALAGLSDNTYVASLVKGKVEGKACNITGRMFVRFGKNNMDRLVLDNNGVQIISEHSTDDIEGERGFIYTVASKNASIDLTTEGIYNNLKDGEIICIRIKDTDAITAMIKVRLLGYQHERYIDLSPEHPSVTLMKVHDSGMARFVMLAYPDVTDESESSESYTIITELIERVVAIEKTIKEITMAVNMIEWEKV